MFDWISSLIGGLFGIGQQFIQNSYNSREAEKNRDFQSDEAALNRVFQSNEAALQRDWSAAEAERARDWNEEMYAKYNSLSGKIAQAEQAGVNPMFAVTGNAVSPMSTTASAPSGASAGSVGTPGGATASSSFVDIVGAMLGFKKVQAETDLLEAEAERNRKEAEKTLIAFYPDEGSMKRYSGMINMPYAFGMKKRDWETGKILGLDVMNADLVKGKNVLIVDDICSRGGTFLHSAKALKEAGAERIFLYVTHAEKTMVEGEMYNNLDLVERIYTTDSIFNIEWDDRNKVTIVNEF